MGTMFLATKECPIHENLKKRLIEARETDTMMTFQSKGDPMRALRNPLALRIQEMEAQGATMQDVIELIGGGKGRRAAAIGDADSTLLSVGQVVARIHDIPTVKELVDRLVSEVAAVRERLDAALGGRR
jgi:nitronate monooxygenase